MKILVTSFEAFGGERVNSAREAVGLLPERVEEIQLVKAEMPTVFGRSIRAAVEAMERHQPDAVLCVGQAGGRSAVTPERIAINMDDAPIADNEGNQPVNRPIDPRSPAAYFSTLPIQDMVAAIRKEGLPAHISNSAGTFVCNHLFYGVLHHISQSTLPVRAGFIHVPSLPEQVSHLGSPGPSMSKEHIAVALRAAIQAIGVECGIDA